MSVTLCCSLAEPLNCQLVVLLDAGQSSVVIDRAKGILRVGIACLGFLLKRCQFGLGIIELLEVLGSSKAG